MGRYRPPAKAKSPYITPQGEKKMREELQTLWHQERPKVTQAVHEAAKNGDRSENGDYIYGKKRLREIDSRVRYLSKRLEQVTVVRDRPANRDRVYFGAVVSVENDAGQIRQYQIVGPDEFDLAQGKLSMDSPLAKALLGKSLDEEVQFNTPSGKESLLVVEIQYR